MSKYCFGVDIGGTAIKMGLFTLEGNLTEKWSINTDLTNKGCNILDDIANSLNKKMEENRLNKADIVGIGVGVPGPVNMDGVVHKCVNLGWDTINVSEKLGELTGLNVQVGNDANVAALGEVFGGIAKGYNNIVMVTLGTGVGGGIIINGKILNGADGAGGEIGHIKVNEDETTTCGCGNKGCLEQYASATGLVKLTKNILDEKNYPVNMKTSLNPENLSAELIFDLAKQGDGVADIAVNKSMKILGTALARISCIVNPEAYVIGGGMAAAGKYLLDLLKEYHAREAFHATKGTDFLLASLGNDAGIYGAAKLVIDTVK